MTMHLQPEEFVGALEGTADVRVTTHLASCAPCREELAALRARWDEVSAADVPEPSPLFWDHFPARVREATTAAPVAGGWWSSPRLTWAAGAASAALVLAAILTWFQPAAPEMTLVDGRATGHTADVTVEFDDVLTAFDGIPVDDVEAFAPASAATWAMVDELTDEERVAFVRLVEQELEALP